LKKANINLLRIKRAQDVPTVQPYSKYKSLRENTKNLYSLQQPVKQHNKNTSPRTYQLPYIEAPLFESRTQRNQYKIILHKYAIRNRNLNNFFTTR